MVRHVNVRQQHAVAIDLGVVSAKIERHSAETCAEFKDNFNAVRGAIGTEVNSQWTVDGTAEHAALRKAAYSGNEVAEIAAGRFIEGKRLAAKRDNSRESWCLRKYGVAACDSDAGRSAPKNLSPCEHYERCPLMKA